MRERSSSHFRRALIACALLGAVALGAIPIVSFRSSGRAADPQPGATILFELRSFRVMGTVLHVAAHPDDENSQLLAYLARGRAYRTAYLSLTRGDGGQNLLGPQLGPLLGVARTQELLAARRLDGGRQFFTRALDFGFSKDYRETLSKWDHQQVLSDVVRVIREFRPDVIVTRFPPLPGATPTHGHHTASAFIALEAFKLAGDPKAFPEQLGELKPWQPKRILMNAGAGGGRGGGPGRGGAAPDTSHVVHMDISGDDPVLGLPFATVAAQSRAMHKTQGFGQAPAGGGGGAGGGGAGGGGGARGGAARPESFTLLAGDPATNDIMDGIDTTWSRVPGGAPIGPLANDVIAKFNPQDPSASVPALLAIRTRVVALPKDPIVTEKRELLDHIIAECLGLTVETVVPRAELVPGEAMLMHHTATVRSSVPVRWVATRYPTGYRGLADAIAMRPNQLATRDGSVTISVKTPLTQPYWLREPGTAGMFRVDDPSLIGRPENPPVFPIEEVFEVGGQTLVLPDQPVQVATDSARGENRRRLDIISPASLHFDPEVGVFAPGAKRAVVVEVTAARARTAGTMHLEPVAGWTVVPASQPFRLSSVGDRARLTFTITAPAHPASADFTAVAEINGARYDNQRIEINYPHIPLQLLQPPARLKTVAFDLATRGHAVGYIPGAGDDTPAAMEQMGYQVTQFTPADLAPDRFPDRLKGLDAVVIGIRASNVRTDLAAALPALFAFADAGGTVVVQYNQATGLRTNTFAPYSLTISAQDRVTDENAAVTFLAPDHPVLNTPNKITSADFRGWVQEQGTYYASQWDAHFVPILASSDSGEAPLKGGLLVAPYGHGYWVYTGLTFFRQLPAGVPGAYRLFANLLSLGK